MELGHIWGKTLPVEVDGSVTANQCRFALEIAIAPIAGVPAATIVGEGSSRGKGKKRDNRDKQAGGQNGRHTDGSARAK